MNLYSDDLCITPEGFERAYSYEEFVAYLQRHGLPGSISFDHDLGEGLSGYDCVECLMDYCLDHQLPLSKFTVYSQSPVDKANIEQVLANFRKNIEF